MTDKVQRVCLLPDWSCSLLKCICTKDQVKGILVLFNFKSLTQLSFFNGLIKQERTLLTHTSWKAQISGPSGFRALKISSAFGSFLSPVGASCCVDFSLLCSQHSSNNSCLSLLGFRDNGKEEQRDFTPEPIAVARANTVRTKLVLDHMPYPRVGR